jgi:hypothetical protein
VEVEINAHDDHDGIRSQIFCFAEVIDINGRLEGWSWCIDDVIQIRI